ncbi:hypothetical protein QM012_005033 [Aureobasidium pullulans]|uniref:C2H2-type domain-containing protein n=1 Tax=Aureobasidium pullulans TaxID=5580 RepID=A0ABR0T7H1_AURPU
MPYNCQRCNYSSSSKGNFKTHLGSTSANHNMGPFVCQDPGCDLRSNRSDSTTPHAGHAGRPTWGKDQALSDALDREVAASFRPAALVPPTAGPATVAAPTAGPASLVPVGHAGPAPFNPGFAHFNPMTTTAPAHSVAAPAAAFSTTASSSTTASPPAFNPALLDPRLRAIMSDGQGQGITYGASTQGEDDEDDGNEDFDISNILAHSENEDTIAVDGDQGLAGPHNSNREYLVRTGVAPLFMEAMKLLSLTDPPLEKPLQWAGNWFVARSREHEGTDEEEVKKEEDENEVKKEDKQDDEKEDAAEDNKADQKHDKEDDETK